MAVSARHGLVSIFALGCLASSGPEEQAPEHVDRVVWVPVANDEPCGPFLVGDKGRLMSIGPAGEVAHVEDDVVIVQKRDGELGVAADTEVPSGARPFLFTLPTGRPVSAACSGKSFTIQGE